MERHLLEQVMELTLKNRDRGDILINSCYREISDIEAEDANVVGVITDIDDIALYFSRSYKFPLPGEDNRGNDGSYIKGSIIPGLILGFHLRDSI